MNTVYSSALEHRICSVNVRVPPLVCMSKHQSFTSMVYSIFCVENHSLMMMTELQCATSHSILLATFTTNIHHIKNNQQPLLLFVWGVHGWFKFEFKVLCCCYRVRDVCFTCVWCMGVGRVGVRSYVCVHLHIWVLLWMLRRWFRFILAVTVIMAKWQRLKFDSDECMYRTYV